MGGGGEAQPSRGTRQALAAHRDGWHGARLASSGSGFCRAKVATPMPVKSLYVTSGEPPARRLGPP